MKDYLNKLIFFIQYVSRLSFPKIADILKDLFYRRDQIIGRKNIKKIIGEKEEVLKKKSNHTSSLWIVSKYYIDKGQPSKGITYLEKLLELKPRFMLAKRYYADHHFLNGDYKKASSWYKQVSLKILDDKAVRMRTIDAFIRAEDIDGFIVFVFKALSSKSFYFNKVTKLSFLEDALLSMTNMGISSHDLLRKITDIKIPSISKSKLNFWQGIFCSRLSEDSQKYLSFFNQYFAFHSLGKGDGKTKSTQNNDQNKTLVVAETDSVFNPYFLKFNDAEKIDIILENRLMALNQACLFKKLDLNQLDIFTDYEFLHDKETEKAFMKSSQAIEEAFQLVLDEVKSIDKMSHLSDYLPAFSLSLQDALYGPLLACQRIIYAMKSGQYSQIHFLLSEGAFLSHLIEKAKDYFLEENIWVGYSKKNRKATKLVKQCSNHALFRRKYYVKWLYKNQSWPKKIIHYNHKIKTPIYKTALKHFGLIYWQLKDPSIQTISRELLGALAKERSMLVAHNCNEYEDAHKMANEIMTDYGLENHIDCCFMDVNYKQISLSVLDILWADSMFADFVSTKPIVNLFQTMDNFSEALPERMKSYFISRIPVILQLIKRVEFSFKQQPPEYLVVCSGRRFTSYILTIAAKRYNVPSFDLNTVWLSKHFNQKKPITDYVLAQDTFTRDLLAGYFKFPEQNIKVIGSIKLQNFQRDIKRQKLEDLHKKFGMKKKPKYLLTFISQPLGENECLESLKKIIHVCQQIDECYLLIKPHPKEFVLNNRVGQYEHIIQNENMSEKCHVIHEKCEMRELIQFSDIIVTFYSNVGLEAAFLDKPVVSINFQGKIRPVDLSELGLATLVKNEKECLRVILGLLSDKHAQDSSRKRRCEYISKNPFSDDKTVESRIIENIKTVVDQRNHA